MSASPSAGVPPPPPRRRRGLRGLAVAAACVVLVDVALSVTLLRDGTLRGHPLPPFEAVMTPDQAAWVDALRTEPAPGTIGRFDPELGWTWIPGASSADGRFTIAPDGARGARSYAPEPPPGALRVVTYGDSFTFGDEIPDDKTFQAQLEARGRGLEVVNHGVGGYGTDQALLRFRRLGTRGARVLFAGLLLENIGRNVNRYRPLWTPRTGFAATKPRFVLGPSGLELVPQPFADRRALHAALTDGSVFDAIAEHEHWLHVPPLPTGRWSSFGRLAGLALAHRARSPERLWRATEAEPFHVTIEVLARFHAEALAAGVEVAAVLVFPSEADLAGLRARGERYWQPLLDELERRGVPVVDLSAPLSEAQDRIDAGTWDAGLYYGAHLSGAGNFVVANRLERWLEDAGLLPSRDRADPGAAR